MFYCVRNISDIYLNCFTLNHQAFLAFIEVVTMIKSLKKTHLYSTIFLNMFLFGCGDEATTQTPQPRLLQVKYETVKKQDITVELTLTGRTSALREAEVRPQVSGIILKRLFTEGSEVKKGQQLYQIDPATYEANLAAAKAELAKAEANAYSIKVRAERYAELIKTKAISQQDYDDAMANKRSAEAQILSAKAAVRSAEINLAYTKVYAPITGIIGKSVFTEGALVTTNQQTPLATIQELDPIYVDLGESVNDLLQTRKEIADGTIQLNKDNKVEVALLFENGEKYSEPGILEFTGVSVDQSTGMVNIRATAKNSDHILLPGMFMRAKFPKGVQKDALMVPQTAVTRANRSDKFVYVIDENDTIQQKFLELGPEVPGYFIVNKGIAEGDRVVMSNIQKISQPGIKVQPVDEQKSNQQGK